MVGKWFLRIHSAYSRIEAECINSFDAYFKAAQQFSIAHANLTDANTAAAEIDRVLTECLLMVRLLLLAQCLVSRSNVSPKARPVYLMLPTDIAYVRIPAARLNTPLNIEPPLNDPETEEFVLDEIVKLVEAAQDDVIILVDACAIRHGVKQEVEELCKRTGYPVYSAPMGKTAVDETYSRYGGVSRRHITISARTDNVR